MQGLDWHLKVLRINAKHLKDRSFCFLKILDRNNNPFITVLEENAFSITLWRIATLSFWGKKAVTKFFNFNLSYSGKGLANFTLWKMWKTTQSRLCMKSGQLSKQLRFNHLGSPTLSVQAGANTNCHPWNIYSLKYSPCIISRESWGQLLW